MSASEPTDPIDWLFARQRVGVQPGLERVAALLDGLGRPDEAFSAVLIAGTNGKGTTAAVLAACLRASGGRVGLYTSPHLGRVAERVEVNGADLGEERLADAVERLRPHALEIGATFFEILTAAALLLFAESGVEIAVMEAGVGGRHDAVNALEPELSIITNVSVDHQLLLGSDVPSIARDKAGVMRAGRPLVTAATGEALAVFEGEAERLGAELLLLGRDFRLQREGLGWSGQRIRVVYGGELLVGVSPLVGGHQAANLALAATAARRLGASLEAIRFGLGATWPGRLERFSVGDGFVVFDGAHNPAGARALAAALDELGERPVWLLGASADKDLPALVAPLLARVRAVVASRARHSPRAADPARLAELTAGEPIDDPQAAFARARELAGASGTVLVAGSLYLVGELRTALLGEAEEGRERWQ